MADQFAPNHKLCYRCQGSGRERGVFYGKDPGDCMDCGGKGVVFKGTPPSPTGVVVGHGQAKSDRTPMDPP